MSLPITFGTMKVIALISTMLVGSGSAMYFAAIAPVPNPTPTTLFGLSMVKLQANATAIGQCSQPSFTQGIKAFQGTTFGKIRIALNVTFSEGNDTYPIILSNFQLLTDQQNTIISNSTSTNSVAPTNTISSFLLFPNRSVILILSFASQCMIPPAQLTLEYNDGAFAFKFLIP